MHLSELLVHENHNYALWIFCSAPPVWRMGRRRRLVVRPGPVWGIVSCVFCSTKLQNCADFVRLCVPCCLSELGAQNEVSQAADRDRPRGTGAERRKVDQLDQYLSNAKESRYTSHRFFCENESLIVLESIIHNHSCFIWLSEFN